MSKLIEMDSKNCEVVKQSEIEKVTQKRETEYSSQKQLPSKKRKTDDLDEESKRNDPDDEYYCFKNKTRGLCLIFSQKTYDEDQNLSIRHGTDKDRDDCEELFDMLGFTVRVFNDLTVNEINDQIERASIEDSHVDSDCIAVVIMTHGKQGDILYGRDGPFAADDIIDKFKADVCPSLAGRPKLFFIQACRGGEEDRGVQIATDSDSNSYKIPTTSDFLICWATYKGYVSIRDLNHGTWFIQSLVKVLTEQAYNDDLQSLMTKVNRHLIKKYPADDSSDGPKQCATVLSTLMKKVKFAQA